MKIPVLLLLVAICNIHLCAQCPQLFEAQVGRKHGYIDSSGRMIIPARFRNAAEFTEGLAAVREGGRYGYINATGEYIIKPIYDFAMPFDDGIAKVFISGKPFFINQHGKQILPAGIAAVKLYGRTGVVKTASGRMGICDLGNFSFLLDTIYGEISEFSEGLATVRKYEVKYSRKTLPVALIDTAGHFVVPFGRYDAIGEFSEGIAWVTKGKYPTQQYGIIDTKGNEIYSRQTPLIYSPAGVYYNGRAKYCSYQPWDFGDDEKKFAQIPSWSGYLDRSGNIVYRDSGINSQEDFSDGRVFIKKAEDQYYIYDTAFHEIGTMNYSRFTRGGFVNGLAIVRDNAWWGIIDTNANIVVPFRYAGIAKIQGGLFFYSKRSENDNELYGISTLGGETVFPATMEDYDHRGFVHGLLKAVIDSRQVYINRQGSIVCSLPALRTKYRIR